MERCLSEGLRPVEEIIESSSDVSSSGTTIRPGYWRERHSGWFCPSPASRRRRARLCFFNRKYNGAEVNYCTTRKDLLAIVMSIHQFRPYLLGQKFLLCKDHSVVQFSRCTPSPIGQQSRWLTEVEEYNFNILHRPEAQHSNGDAL